MKKNFILMMAMLLPLASFAQDVNAKKLTKFEEFTSKTGSIVKFVDIKMPSIPTNLLGRLSSRIRTFKGEESVYFFRIESGSSNSVSDIAMIEYSDLVEINKALVRLTSEFDSDHAEQPYYLENKFSTVDGFEVGYYIDGGKSSWFLKLERYTDRTVFINSIEALIKAFTNAQTKIEELKAAGKQPV